MNYFKKVLVAVDQLGNAIAAGNPDNTISARVGYFAYLGKKRTRWYWLFLQRIINTTFYPMDGRGHCWQAYQSDGKESFEAGSDFVIFVLSFIIIVTCPVIIAIVYPCWMVYGFYQIVKTANDPLNIKS